MDTASQDAAGASSVEHVFTVAAVGGPFDFALVLNPLGVPDLQVLVKANASGQPGDTVSAYAAMSI